ncbi:MULTISPECIES: PD-(D/E)XK nuclease family protein [unclassified Streptomyces]|uniref:PD-(D/E)XK nuclease family protein n=1 Tax=unclassified Streptomyces TaxID=2593676 RepID=UPI002E0FE80C|nr:PD-(D/E)XK nuclease family protein [Streptomyces sp. NBC_01197]WSS49012.1 PD-(D/E)XK nuclease family protein [Streptomyces sp. NBC_01180]
MSVATIVDGAAPSIWDAAHDVDARRPRSLQTQLGASDTVCGRRAAYILHGVTPTDNADKRAAILGTFIHYGLLESARTEYGWLVERSVQDGLIRGHVDVVQLDAATAARLPARHRPAIPADVLTVEDVKTKSTYMWDRVLRYGATAAELRQVYLYAGALHECGFENVPGQRYLSRLGPLDIGRIRFRFINRDSGAEHIQEIEFDPQRAAEAQWWVERVRETSDPEAMPRDFNGPGLDAICDYCPFRSLCWPGTAPGVPEQTALIHNDDDREQALIEYVKGHELASEGNRVKNFARKKLDRSPAGVYGPNKLSWRGGNDEEKDDVEAMVDLHEIAGISVPMRPDADRMVKNLKAAGLPVPRRKTGKKTAPVINVAPA